MRNAATSRSTGTRTVGNTCRPLANSVTAQVEDRPHRRHARFDFVAGAGDAVRAAVRAAMQPLALAYGLREHDGNGGTAMSASPAMAVASNVAFRFDFISPRLPRQPAHRHAGDASRAPGALAPYAARGRRAEGHGARAADGHAAQARVRDVRDSCHARRHGFEIARSLDAAPMQPPAAARVFAWLQARDSQSAKPFARAVLRRRWDEEIDVDAEAELEACAALADMPPRAGRERSEGPADTVVAGRRGRRCHSLRSLRLILRGRRWRAVLRRREDGGGRRLAGLRQLVSPAACR